jgi:hypothetical protein
VVPAAEVPENGSDSRAGSRRNCPAGSGHIRDRRARPCYARCATVARRRAGSGSRD